jgi:hypothetical protein
MQSKLRQDEKCFISKIKIPDKSRTFGGADDRNRTGDLILTKDVLYLLSYISAKRPHYTCGVSKLQPLIFCDFKSIDKKLY